MRVYLCTYMDVCVRACVCIYVQRKPPIIETFNTQAHAPEVISATWLFFGTEIPHHFGAWATKFQISNASFSEFITEEA